MSKKKKLKNRIWEAEVTLYKTGNLLIKLTNKLTKEVKTLQTGEGKEGLHCLRNFLD